jgi:hypothetical protein
MYSKVLEARGTLMKKNNVSILMVFAFALCLFSNSATAKDKLRCYEISAWYQEGFAFFDTLARDIKDRLGNSSKFCIEHSGNTVTVQYYSSSGKLNATRTYSSYPTRSCEDCFGFKANGFSGELSYNPSLANYQFRMTVPKAGNKNSREYVRYVTARPIDTVYASSPPPPSGPQRRANDLLERTKPLITH